MNSAHWSGELLYFAQEEEIVDDESISNNINGLKYPLNTSVSDGAVLTDSEVKV